MIGAKWIRFVHSQEHIKEILDWCVEEKKDEREKVLNELVIWLDTEHFWDDEISETILLKKIEELRKGEP